MKKNILCIAIAIVAIATSCERTTYLATRPNYITVQVGDTTSFETRHVREKDVTFSMAGQQDDPMTSTICRIGKEGYDPQYTQRIRMKVFALNPGRDTIHIDYEYKVGTTKYNDRVLIPVLVTEKPTEE